MLPCLLRGPGPLPWPGIGGTLVLATLFLWLFQILFFERMPPSRSSHRPFGLMITCRCRGLESRLGDLSPSCYILSLKSIPCLYFITSFCLVKTYFCRLALHLPPFHLSAYLLVPCPGPWRAEAPSPASCARGPVARDRGTAVEGQTEYIGPQPNNFFLIFFSGLHFMSVFFCLFCSN